MSVAAEEEEVVVVAPVDWAVSLIRPRSAEPTLEESACFGLAGLKTGAAAVQGRLRLRLRGAEPARP